jgi:thiol:disulfide interchange protein DsbA|tara:strand:+ start:3284 stop:3988 length:705 start_codon:yes stop_codon:yes gene_type:complete
MAKKATRFLVQQKIAVGLVAATIIVLIGYFSTLVVKESPMLGDFIEGEHYTLLEKPRRIRSDKIEVMEFFSYGCIHCYNFDPSLTDWVDANIDRINFIRTPVVSSDYWRILGRNYYAMEKLGLIDEHHLPFFREVQEVKRNFSPPTRLGDYFDGRGITADEYMKTFNSPDLASKISAADQMARRLKVASVPTIIIHGKYKIRPTRAVGISRMLDVMNFLIDKELSEKSGEPGES